MSMREIEAAIPHRPPMLLLDRILQRDENSIRCEKRFFDDEFFFQGHFPGQPIVPGVIQCECCLQAGAVLLHQRLAAQVSADDESAAPSENLVPVATRMDSVKFKAMVHPGDVVEISVELKDQVSNAFFMTGKVKVNGKLATRLDFACSVASVPKSTPSP